MLIKIKCRGTPKVMRLINIFKSGQLYLQIFPNDKLLALSFPEIKIIHYMKVAKKYLPPAIIALFVWHYYMHAQLAITVITALFALSLPIQGIFLLGKRALAPLPLNLLGWYNQIKQQLIKKEILSPKSDVTDKVNFIEFIKLLNLAKLHLGSYFGENQDDHNNFMTFS